jgi:hypothetical protein
MQCNDVIRQLAVQTDDVVPLSIAEHLAGCTACAEWAKRASQLDRLWEATRAPDPSPEAWEGVWNRVIESLDSPPSMHVEHQALPAALGNGSMHASHAAVVKHSGSSFNRRSSLAKVISFGLAQAAAVFIAISVVWQFFPSMQKPGMRNQPPSLVGNTAPRDASSLSVDIEEGNLVMIEAVGDKPQVFILRSETSRLGIDEWLLMFNHVEAMAPNSVVAMKE